MVVRVESALGVGGEGCFNGCPLVLVAPRPGGGRNSWVRWGRIMVLHFRDILEAIHSRYFGGTDIQRYTSTLRHFVGLFFSGIGHDWHSILAHFENLCSY